MLHSPELSFFFLITCCTVSVQYFKDSPTMPHALNVDLDKHERKILLDFNLYFIKIPKIFVIS